MIPLNFYRDDNYVYYNNPNGITKKMTIAEFEAMMSGESELPTYSSSNSGEVLSVDSDGDLEWISLQPSGGGFPIHVTINNGSYLDKTWNEIKQASIAGKPLVVVDSNNENDILFYPVYEVYIDGSDYDVLCSYLNPATNVFGSFKFIADSANGYPLMSV